MAKNFSTAEKRITNLKPARNLTARSNGKPSQADQVFDIQVKIDTSKLLIGDIRFMNRVTSMPSDDPEDFERMMQFLDRVVVGGVDQYPMDAIPQIYEAVFSQIQNQRAARSKNSRKPRLRGRG